MCLRCCRLRLVTRPDPSNLTRYWSWGSTSTTQPDLSHLVGWGPHWFWTSTRDWGFSGGRVCVWGRRESACWPNRTLSASSRARHVSCHTGDSLAQWNMLVLGGIGMRSRRGRPNRIIAGDMPVVGSGVLRYWTSPATTRLSSSVPSGLVCPCSSRFIDFTATSALPLLLGWYAAESRCLTPHLPRNSCVSAAVNSGPPSLLSSSGAPKVANMYFRLRMRPCDPAASSDFVARMMWGHALKRSTITRYFVPWTEN